MATGSALWTAAVVAVGVALMAWGLLAEQATVAAAGAATLAGALAWSLARPRSRRAPVITTPETGVPDILRGIPVRSELLERPGESLVSELERIRELVRRHVEIGRALDATKERVRDVDRSARELARSLGRGTVSGAEAIAHDLDRQVRDAERSADAADMAERELTRLRNEVRVSTARLESVESERSALLEHVGSVIAGEPTEALEALGERMEAHRRADQLEDEILRGHPDLAALRAQIEELDRSGVAWAVDDSSLAQARARIEGRDEEIEVLLRRGESLEVEIARLRGLETVDAVDSEIASLREEQERLVRERDRKWVLAHLLRDADRRFREEHQPDLVRRAGSYLRHLTGGRYERLVVDEAHGEHLFHLVGPTFPAPIPLAPPVSTGTLEQAYLSLRLAIVDHLDRGGEKLPLFVDEVLVNWDGERRARGLEVLAGISATRQVFVFTCHPGVAAELEEGGGRVLRLGVG